MAPVARLLLLVLVSAVVACGGEGGEPMDLLAPGFVASGDAIQHMRLSPDGSTVAFLAFNDDLPSQLRLFVADSSTTRQLSPEGMRVRSFAWLPDSEGLIVGEPIEGAGSVRRTVLHVVGLDGDTVRSLEPDTDFRVRGAMVVRNGGEQLLVSAMAPDSDLLTPADIVEVSLTDGSVRWLTETETISETAPLELPDGSVVFSGFDEESPGRRATLMRLSGGEAESIETAGVHPRIATFHEDFGLVFDGVPVDSGTIISGVFAVPLEGGTPRQIWGAAMADPVISADGKTLLGRPTGGPNIGDIVAVELPSA